MNIKQNGKGMSLQILHTKEYQGGKSTSSNGEEKRWGGEISL